MRLRPKLLVTSTLFCGLSFLGCHQDVPIHPDRPYVAEGVVMKDVVFHSAALNRDMPYRVFLPKNVNDGTRLPVVYLLHGGNGSYRDWSDDSTVSSYAVIGMILVMPEGEFSYYMNSVKDPAARFEDYTFGDLLADVESRFPVAKTRNKRAVIGISMGGFAAIKIALTRPDLFSFVAALSPPIDVAHRQFRLRRWGEWWRIRKIFGSSESEERRSRDPISLVQTADRARTAYFYILPDRTNRC